MCGLFFCVFFFKQKTAYEMRISDWSSDVCSSDLRNVDLPLSFVDRLEIWDHAAGAVAAAPMLGTGLGSVKYLPMSDEQRDRYRFHKAPSTHGHNAALQPWVEFGAVGIAAALDRKSTRLNSSH